MLESHELTGMSNDQEEQHSPLITPEAALEEGFVPSTKDGGPCGEGNSCDSSASKEAGDSQLPCAFYMRTGTCAYGERCKFSHPVDRPTVHMNSRGLPLRPSEPQCSFYVRNGWCSFSETCKFHHPELPNTHPAAAAAAPWTSPPPAAGGRSQGRESTPSAAGSANQRPHNGKHAAQQPYKNSKQQQQQQQHGGYMGAAYMQPMSPYGAPIPAAGPSVIVPYGYYHPAMSPDARMCTAATAPMAYPVFHMRPYINMPMVGPPPYQVTQQMQNLSVTGNISRSGSGSSRSRGYQGANSSSNNSGKSSSGTGQATGRTGGSRDAGNGSSSSSYNSRRAAAAEAPAGYDTSRNKLNATS